MPSTRMSEGPNATAAVDKKENKKLQISKKYLLLLPLNDFNTYQKKSLSRINWNSRLNDSQVLKIHPYVLAQMYLHYCSCLKEDTH